jgi:hypothetical protein
MQSSLSSVLQLAKRELKRPLPIRYWLLYGLVGLVLVSAAALTVPTFRGALLRSAGHWLVADDPAKHADVIVIAVDADGAGVLEAADLVHAGVASRVAVFPDPPDAIDLEYLRRGIPYHDEAAAHIRELHAMGVQSVEVIPWAVTGTTEEGAVLKRWCAASGLRSVLFISTPDHSRRSRRMLDRYLHGSGTQVFVRYARYSEFDPNNWWRTRNGVRTEVFETEKLLKDLLRHPFS